MAERLPPFYFKGKQMEEEDSKKLHHIPCEECGSKDNAAVYSDGHTYCFGCTATKSAEDGAELQAQTPKRPMDLIDGYYSALPVRGITEETCRKFDYQITDNYNRRPQQIANYRDSEGVVVAQKIRDAEKNFSILGDAKRMTLFGQHLWNGGRKLVITEGELDAMSVSQVQGNKWPTVSLAQGATSGKKALIAAWEWLDQFEEIILMFDQDEVGQKAALECAELLPVGKVKIAKLPHKDANLCLQKGEGKAIIDAIWQAKEWRPDGIFSSHSFIDEICEPTLNSTVAYPYPKLNDMTRGIRTGLVTICAGTGAGKSTFVKEIAYDLHKNGHTVGMIMLEESKAITMQSLIGIFLERNIISPKESGTVTKELIKDAYWENFTENQVHVYDTKGVADIDIVVKRIQYMVRGMGCKYLFLDPISVLVAGITGQVTDERRLIDSIIVKLRNVIQELDICLFLVSHLSRPVGKGHEDGGKVKISELRGSSSIAMLSDFCIGLQKMEDSPMDDTREIVLLKNRFTGEVGNADTLEYNRATGRLIEADSRF